MDALLIALALAAAPPAVPAPAPDDSLPSSPRVVRRLAEVVVRARRTDPFATHTTRTLEHESLARLPLDRLADALVLQPGVVARGDQLHVRGGRAGESPFTIDGMPLEEPFRRRALEVPMLALDRAEVLTGAIEAAQPGALAGVLAASFAPPPAHPSAEARWRTAVTQARRSDRVAARAGTPIARTGLGVVLDADATLTDPPWRDLRSHGRRRVLGGSFGWRADDRVLGHARIGTTSAADEAAARPGPRAALDLVAGRRIDQPYDPMWSLDGYCTPCGQPELGCITGPGFSLEPKPGYVRYRAADHKTMTDARHLGALASASRGLGATRVGASLGALATREITSLGGRDDPSYLDPASFPVFGMADSPVSDPFHVYAGDEPYFRRRIARTLWSQVEAARPTARGRVAGGLGATWEHLELREVDLSQVKTGADSVRAWTAEAPGAFAWAQARWAFEGLVANAGLRAEWFSAGRLDGAAPPGGARGWSLSPRLGIAYPVSVRDVFSLAYARIEQAPPRDVLYDDRTVPPNARPLGNPAIGPATVVTYEAAVRHLFDRGWSLQASTFFRDLYGVVVTRREVVYVRLPVMRYVPDGEAQVTGIELSARHDSERLQLSLAYTWMDARGTLSREEGVPYGPRLGDRSVVIGQHPLEWDRRHTVALAWAWTPSPRLALSGTTLAGSGLPWTPAERRALSADVSLENSRRLRPSEETALELRWTPLEGGRLTLGLEALNLFDERTEETVSVDGYPQPLINTYFDDYAAYRTETGRGGGAYWNDRDGDGRPGWVPVHDPRLYGAPRLVRVTLGTRW